MKKQLTLMALAFGITGAMAQDLTSKKGEQYLPEAKDWCVGIDANPFLNYAGNFFGKTSPNAAPTFSFLNSNQAVVGKYFVDAETAYRSSLRIGYGSNTQRQMVTDRFAAGIPTGVPNNYPTLNAQKENSWKHSSSTVGLSVGLEKRRGKTRLQGYYGGEIGFYISSSKDKFTYGNKLNPFNSVSTNTANPVVTVTNADNFSGANNIITVNTAGTPTGRITERKNGSTFSFGLRGFIGVEYFILPKISLGGEFGWALGLSTQGKSTSKVESIGNTGGTSGDTIGTTTIESAKNGSFKIDTDNLNSVFGPSGSIRLNFHF